MEFIRSGARVLVAEVQDDVGRAVAAELSPGAAYTRSDVTDEAQNAAAVNLSMARHGRLKQRSLQQRRHVELVGARTTSNSMGRRRGGCMQIACCRAEPLFCWLPAACCHADYCRSFEGHGEHRRLPTHPTSEGRAELHRVAFIATGAATYLVPCWT
ncbi:hypothetical protein ACP4OV_013459 [Aristida adscensionis]